MEEVLKNASWVFWHTACSEFRATMASNKGNFSSISLSLGEMERNMLLEEVLSCEKHLSAQMDRSYFEPTFFFKKEKAKDGLRRASAEVIAAFEKRWKTGEDYKKARPEVNAEIIRFFRCMAHLKKMQCRIIAIQPPIAGKRCFHNRSAPCFYAVPTGVLLHVPP